MSIMVKALDYTYQVGHKKLLDRVALQIGVGQRVAIIGPNGAGKSTLLKSMMGILPYGDGDMIVNGKRLNNYAQKELAKWVSYVPQFSPFDEFFTVRDYMLMGRFAHLSPFSWITRDDHDAVDKALEKIGMLAYADRAMNTLSGGEQQKVLIGTALVQGAKMMLLDEPVAFLDPKEQAVIYRLLHDLHHDCSLTLVEVTHDINRAARAHDRIIGMRNGRIVFDGAPHDFLDSAILRSIYQQKFEFYHDPRNGNRLVLPGGPDARAN